VSTSITILEGGERGGVSTSITILEGGEGGERGGVGTSITLLELIDYVFQSFFILLIKLQCVGNYVWKCNILF